MPQLRLFWNTVSAGEILYDLGLCKVRVISNNPLKLRAIEESGLKIVERVSIEVDATEDAADYLRTKKEKLGHLLNLEEAIATDPGPGGFFAARQREGHSRTMQARRLRSQLLLLLLN